MILVRVALEHRRTPRPTLAKDRTARMIPPKLLKVLLQTAAMVPEIRALVLTLQVEVEVMMKVMAVMMETRRTAQLAWANKTKIVVTPLMRRHRRMERA